MTSSFLSAAISLFIPIFIKGITDNFSSIFSKDPMKGIVKVGIHILLLILIKLGCDYFTLYQGKLLGAKIEADMRLELFNHYQKMSLDFFYEHKNGELLSIMTTDLVNISDVMHYLPEDLFQIIIRIGGVFVVFFVLNVFEGLVLLFIFISMGLFLSAFLHKRQIALIQNHKNIASINSKVEEYLLGIKTIKAFSNENVETKKFEKKNRKHVQAQTYAFKIIGISHAGLIAFVTSILPVVTILGIVLLYNKQISNGTLLFLLLSESTLVNPIFSLVEQLRSFQNAMAGFCRLCEILEIKATIIEPKYAITLKNIKGNISFKKVSFRYKPLEKNILNDISIEIKSGEYLALVGRSGVGKSTLCNLIARFYDVQSGEICIDNIPIKHIQIKSLRKNIGFLQQNVFLFSDSIINNIRYGDLNASQDEIIEAAKRAYAHEFITDLKNGYDTFIGEKGINLSSGQKQRIAIARIFLKKPKILIFDEPTSNLDNESEKYIKQSIDKLSIDCTTIVIAHRLSTVKDAKRILVLDKSNIIEDGTHEDLINKKGVYYNLYKLQI